MLQLWDDPKTFVRMHVDEENIELFCAFKHHHYVGHPGSIRRVVCGDGVLCNQFRYSASKKRTVYAMIPSGCYFTNEYERQHPVDAYKAYLTEHPDHLRLVLETLFSSWFHGIRTLGCFCPLKYRCHIDILNEYWEILMSGFKHPSLPTFPTLTIHNGRIKVGSSTEYRGPSSKRRKEKKSRCLLTLAPDDILKRLKAV